MPEPAVADLVVGERVVLQHGPFRSTWRVVEIKTAGAVLEITEEPEFVGYAKTLTAHNGDVLTTDPRQEWLGRAHFSSVKRHEEWPGRQELSVRRKAT